VKARSEPTPPQNPLVWPEDFPPTDPVKKFFYGIRWLGPDISFFKRLQAQQAARTEAQMAAWTDAKERQVVQVFGKCLCKAIGWKTPYFIPADSAVTVSYGPKFRSMEEFLFEEATREYEQRVGKRFRKRFWENSIDWNDKNVPFGELIRKVVMECENAPPRQQSRWKAKLRRLFGLSPRRHENRTLNSQVPAAACRWSPCLPDPLAQATFIPANSPL
jgi:hypothetical protein